jgi:hypothetical protein
VKEKEEEGVVQTRSRCVSCLPSSSAMLISSTHSWSNPDLDPVPQDSPLRVWSMCVFLSSSPFALHLSLPWNGLLHTLFYRCQQVGSVSRQFQQTKKTNSSIPENSTAFWASDNFGPGTWTGGSSLVALGWTAREAIPFAFVGGLFCASS